MNECLQYVRVFKFFQNAKQDWLAAGGKMYIFSAKSSQPRQQKGTPFHFKGTYAFSSVVTEILISELKSFGMPDATYALTQAPKSF